VHHLHIWSPNPHCGAVATLHVSLRHESSSHSHSGSSGSSSGDAAEAREAETCGAIRAILHRNHVHTTTIQVERVPADGLKGGPVGVGQSYRCLGEPVCPDPACVAATCCPTHMT
jgi:hypothetical protein